MTTTPANNDDGHNYTHNQKGKHRTLLAGKSGQRAGAGKASGTITVLLQNGQRIVRLAPLSSWSKGAEHDGHLRA